MFSLAFVLASVFLGEQADCASVTDSKARLACYDSAKKEFGVVAGRISAISASSRPHPLPTEVVLVPYPLTEQAKSVFRAHGLESVQIRYSDIAGLTKGSAALDGEFRISHVPAGRYLAIIFSNAFSMQPSGYGCGSWTDGALAPKSGPDYVSTCRLVEVHSGEETSIFETLRGSPY